MKVYHGSTFIVKEPNIEMVNSRTDFGKGFYTTSNYEQAKKWSKIKKDRLDEKVNMYVNIYEYTEDETLNILVFKEATEEWVKFVFLNRYSNVLVHEYDIVKGPVADDNVYTTLNFYEDKVYTLEETIKRLKTYVLVDQISFHTKKALESLKYIETIEIEGSVKNG